MDWAESRFPAKSWDNVAFKARSIEVEASSSETYGSVDHMSVLY